MYAADVTTVIQFFVVGLSVALALVLLLIEFSPVATQVLHTREAKAGLRSEIGRLRLPHLLHLRGVSLRTFVETLSPAELRRAAASCRGCEQTATCEDHLSGRVRGRNHAFCPNAESIDSVVRVVALNRL